MCAKILLKHWSLYCFISHTHTHTDAGTGSRQPLLNQAIHNQHERFEFLYLTLQPSGNDFCLHAHLPPFICKM